MDMTIDAGGAGGVDRSDNADSTQHSAGASYSRAWRDAVTDAKTQHPDQETDKTTSAGSMIAAATDPKTGAVDVDQMARAVAQAVPVSMDKASRAYQDISSSLAAHDPAAAQRFDSAVVTAMHHAPDALAGVSRGASHAGSKLLVDNPILTKIWEPTTSPLTGKGGFSQPLEDMLKSHGIEVAPRVNAAPAGGLTKSSGVPQSKANNVNGDLARDAIADRYRAQGAKVSAEVPTNGGSRRVDVRADFAAKDPRYNTRVEVESKLGYTSNKPSVATQAAKDGESLAENAKLRGLGAGLETVGKVALPVAVAADAVQLGQAFHEDGNRIGKHTGEAASSVAGGWAGAETGAVVGAEVGSLGGPVGTVVGGLVGGIAGSIAGSSLGKDAFNAISSIF
jgi:hypothetical protein